MSGSEFYIIESVRWLTLAVFSEAIGIPAARLLYRAGFKKWIYLAALIPGVGFLAVLFACLAKWPIPDAIAYRYSSRY